MALFHYYDTATVRNQHQLLTFKTSKYPSLLLKKTIIFRIIIKNLTKCNTLSTFELKTYGKFTDHNLEKLCPRSLASTIPILGLKRVCLRKVGPWPWLRIFLSPWPFGLERCVLDSISGTYNTSRVISSGSKTANHSLSF